MEAIPEKQAQSRTSSKRSVAAASVRSAATVRSLAEEAGEEEGGSEAGDLEGLEDVLAEAALPVEQESDDEFFDLGPVTANGRFLSFLERWRHGLARKALRSKRKLPRAVRRMMAVEIGGDARPLAICVQSVVGALVPERLMRREIMESDLGQMLQSFWRRRQPPEPRASHFGVLRQFAKAIVKDERQVRCVAIALAAFATPPIHLRVHESYPAKESRLQPFWQQFHRGFRKGEAKVLGPAKGERQSLVTVADEDLGMLDPETLGLKRTTSGVSEVAHTWGGEAHNRIGLLDMNWKMRSARTGISSTSARVRRTNLEDGVFTNTLTMSTMDPDDERALDRAMSATSSLPLSLGRTLSRTAAGGAPMVSAAQTRNSVPPFSPTSSTSTVLSRTGWWAKKAKERVAEPSPRSVNGIAGYAGGDRPAPLAAISQRKGGNQPKPLAKMSRMAPPLPRLQKSESLPEIRKKKTFSAPHSEKLPPALRPPDLPSNTYLQICDRAGIVPATMPFITGDSDKLDAVGQSLDDAELHALAKMARGMKIEEVDFTNNSLLTDRGISNFLEVLVEDPACRTMRKLSLRNCHLAASSVFDGVLNMLDDGGCSRLRHLDISGIRVSIQHQLRLCTAIQKHSNLTNVCLANTGLGSNGTVMQCVMELIGSGSVRHLDIGWNSLNAEVCAALGEQLVDAQLMKSLVLTNASASRGHMDSETHLSPIVYFIEHLHRDHTLVNLDISMNRIDARAALVIEDALSTSRVRELSVSHNQMGVFGLRSMMRLLARRQSVLTRLSCEDCFQGDDCEDPHIFSVTNPGGYYSLDLSLPTDRSKLRMLYKVCEQFKLAPESAFFDVSYSLYTYKHPTGKDETGVWPVPTIGKLSLNFSIQQVMEKALAKVDQWDFNEVLEVYYSSVRIDPQFGKLVPMLAQWIGIDGRAIEQEVLLEALSRDFLIPYSALNLFCRNKTLIPKIIGTLLPSVSGGKRSAHQAMLLVKNVPDFVACASRAADYLDFNPAIVTGHYNLDLSNPNSAAVAQALMLLDRWETSVAKRLGRLDTSQKGDHSRVRNVLYQYRPLPVASFADWNLPESHFLEMDYVTGKRPSKTSPVLDDEHFDQLLVSLGSSSVMEEDKIKVLRMVAHDVFVTCLQMRSLLNMVKDSSARKNLAVIFLFQVVDMTNEKLFRVRFEDAADVRELRERLGFLTYFPFIQPEYESFELDFAQYDQRMAANLLIKFASAEGLASMKQPQYVLPDGTTDPLPLGVPRSWDTFDKMPTSGVFSFLYVTSPQDRNFKVRKGYYESFGYWESDAEYQDVHWVVGIGDVPSDVLEYLFFIRTKYKDTEAAFQAIALKAGTGSITCQNFEAAYMDSKCPKFKGANEMERVKNVFRFLDPNGGGDIAMNEFGVLTLMWEEVTLSIREFVQFCLRTFGANLSDTWDAIDTDASGKLDFAEWMGRLSEVGYYGPAKPIFDFLDEDDAGQISLQEFFKLQKFLDDARQMREVK